MRIPDLSITPDRLRSRYVVALSLIAMLVLVSQAIIQISIARQEHDSRIVNIAGRQRMLSQKITKTGYYLAAAHTPEQVHEFSDQLQQALALWQRSHRGLQKGDAKLELPGENSGKVRALFGNIEPYYQAMVAAANRILAAPDDRASLSEATKQLAANEPRFLAGMDAIVFRYDAEAKERVVHIQHLEVVLTVITLLVLVLEARLIFAPAIRRLRQDLRENERSQAALAINAERLRLSMAAAQQSWFDLDLETQQAHVGKDFADILGAANADAGISRRAWMASIHPDDKPAVMRAYGDMLASGEARQTEYRLRTRAGDWKWIHCMAKVVQYDGQKRPLRVVGTHIDITERKRTEMHERELEMQLRESQKMEAVGLLAGGVAHDFNNILSTIMGNTALAKEDVRTRPDEALLSLNEIEKAGQRARKLVQQILAFSRKEKQSFAVQPLQPVLEESVRLLRAAIPAGIAIVPSFDEAPIHVRCNATQIEQVLVNLCTNAWHATNGKGGRIEIGLEQSSIAGSEAAQALGINPGLYACLRIRDDGCGMDEATLGRIFEPFFTTKAVGTGTGLGLSVVHGIVKSHKGAVKVQSKPGLGSTFEIYLPAATQDSAKMTFFAETKTDTVAAEVRDCRDAHTRSRLSTR